MEAEKRGSIAFFSTYRPPLPLDIFSSSIPPVSKIYERHMTDKVSYNYNGQFIPMESLKKVLRHIKLGSQEAEEAIIVEDEFSGMAFVSERETLELLHFCVYQGSRRSKVYSFSECYGTTFRGIRMEDSARFSGDYLIYISTIDPLGNKIKIHRQPWTAAYKLNLSTGKNEPLTPPGQADLSPSISPSGKKIAVASFQNKGGWNGEIEDLKTDIYVMNIDEPFERTLVIENGGWPTWGSNDVIFFHRKDENKFWGVFRADISKGVVPSDAGDRVTPEGMSAMTPAAIDATTVAVVIIRQSSLKFAEVRDEPQYRHIEVFDSTKKHEPTEITRKINPKADHFNPFVLDGGKSIGYHRCRIDAPKDKDLVKVSSPVQDVGLYRSPGVFPTFNKDGSKFAYVDNEFKAVYVGNSKGEMKIVKQYTEVDSVFSPVWNQSPDKDILYICVGHSFQPEKAVEIHAFFNVSSGTGEQQPTQLTMGGFNNAFPSTNPDGTKFVFRSTRDGGDNRSKSLYIMEDAEKGETEGGIPTRITHNKPRLDGQVSVDTHCEWSPSGEWIVFSSTRDKPEYKPDDNGLDPGYFAVYLLKADDPSVVLEVIKSGSDYAGHVNHPFFSPEGMSIVVAADLAAVSVDPISLPFFMHSVRPYGDIFTIDIDWENLTTDGKVVNLKKVSRATHSRYENSTCTWAAYSSTQMRMIWDILSENVKAFTPSCPYVHADGGEGWQMTGQLLIPTRRC